jgi:hypothetical protein
MIATGWTGEPVQELPASQHVRMLAEVLADGPTTRGMRDAERAERAEAQARADHAKDSADMAAAEAFMRSVNGSQPRNVLAEAMRGDAGIDREQMQRRRAAIEILKRHDLADQIAGHQSGVVFSEFGVYEPPKDERATAAMDRTYELERSEREAEARNRAVAQYRVQLDERMRARGYNRLESHRSAVPDDAERRRYEAACREIGCEPERLSFR